MQHFINQLMKGINVENKNNFFKKPMWEGASTYEYKWWVHLCFWPTVIILIVGGIFHGIHELYRYDMKNECNEWASNLELESTYVVEGYWRAYCVVEINGQLVNKGDYVYNAGN